MLAARQTQARRAAGPEAAPDGPPAKRVDPDEEDLEALLKTHNGSVAAVARATGMSRQALYRRLERAGLAPDDFRA